MISGKIWPTPSGTDTNRAWKLDRWASKRNGWSHNRPVLSSMAGTVVTLDVPDYSVVGGIPGRVIGTTPKA